MPILGQVKASVRYLSCEPLFERVVLKDEWLANTEGSSQVESRVIMLCSRSRLV